MKAIATCKEDQFITLELKTDQDYEIVLNEPFELHSLKKTYLDEIRGLYWSLLHWIVVNKLYLNLPEADKYFKISDCPELTEKKLYTISRFVSNWITKEYDNDGCEIPGGVAKTTRGITQHDFSNLYEKTVNYFSRYIDMTEFNDMTERKRVDSGKY